MLQIFTKNFNQFITFSSSNIYYPTLSLETCDNYAWKSYWISKNIYHIRPCCFLRDERNVLNLRNQIFEKVATLKKVKLNSCADFLQASHDSFVLKRSKLQISVKVTLEGCFPGQGSIHCYTYKLTKMGPGTSLYHCQDFISCFSL